jgi:hypothetical protein
MDREHVMFLTGPLMFPLSTIYHSVTVESNIATITTIESIIPTMTTFSTGRVPMPSVAPSEAPPPPPSLTKPSAIDNLARIPAGLWVLIFLVVGFILTGGTFFFIKRQKAKPRNEVS